MKESDEKRLDAALDALIQEDPEALSDALASDPGVVDLKVGDYTLLELMTQPSASAVNHELAQVLIDNGASMDRALNLAACWNLRALCRQLIDAGARPEVTADAGITPLESAVMHAATDAADLLVEYGLHRPSLWLAAGVGQLSQVQAWVGSDGELLLDPDHHRPDWADVGRPKGSAPTQDFDEIRGEALVFAALNGREAVVQYLLSVGVSIDARPYRNTTGLHFAIQFKQVDMVEYLLASGASVSILDDQYESDAAGWAEVCDNGDSDAERIRLAVDAASAA